MSTNPTARSVRADLHRLGFMLLGLFLWARRAPLKVLHAFRSVSPGSPASRCRFHRGGRGVSWLGAFELSIVLLVMSSLPRRPSRPARARAGARRQCRGCARAVPDAVRLAPAAARALGNLMMRTAVPFAAVSCDAIASWLPDSTDPAHRVNFHTRSILCGGGVCRLVTRGFARCARAATAGGSRPRRVFLCHLCSPPPHPPPPQPNPPPIVGASI
jgi:hypothetical protein